MPVRPCCVTGLLSTFTLLASPTGVSGSWPAMAVGSLLNPEAVEGIHKKVFACCVGGCFDLEANRIIQDRDAHSQPCFSLSPYLPSSSSLSLSHSQLQTYTNEIPIVGLFSSCAKHFKPNTRCETGAANTNNRSNTYKVAWPFPWVETKQSEHGLWAHGLRPCLLLAH